jgi:hypothetical protein
MAETPAAGALEAQQAQAAAEAARIAAEGAIAGAAVAAAGAQEVAAEKAEIMADKTQQELNKYSERFDTWQQEVNQSLSASQAAAAERFQKLQEQQEALAAGQLLLAENLKSLTLKPSQETVSIETEMIPEELAKKEAGDALKAAQTKPKKPLRRRI